MRVFVQNFAGNSVYLYSFNPENGILYRRQQIILFFFFFALFCHAQMNNLRFRSIVLNRDTIIFDSLSIAPETFQLDHPADTLFCKIDFSRKALIRLRPDTGFRVVSFRYRVFPLDFNREYFRKDVRKLNKDLSLPENPFNLIFSDGEKPRENLIAEQDGLSKNGSISRGIQFGNNQDVVVNSNMNLQVSGKLTKDIELSMAATDNNIPIQAEGNTQQLQEFDKVFIQLNDKQSKMVVGDFQIDRPKSYFMNFYKRTQGVLFSNSAAIITKENKKAILNTTLTAAVSRGRFARNIIQGSENNQGPYRLRGADNETFIIVLSGTEKVYIDGKLLVRGQENDYIIDYNNSEVTFTARNIITKDRRIIVEFQYAERNYARALYFMNTEYKNDKTRLFFNFYQESDNRNKTLMQELTNDHKLLMVGVGDTLASAVVPGFQQATFNSTEVFYRKTDTLVNAVLYPDILVYNTSPDSVSYRVRFSFVGTGKGNYRQTQSSANGRVYQWIAPINGILQGDHEPVIQLVTPKKKNMLSGGIDQNFGRKGKMNLELATTLNDLNTFSTFDSRDDRGQGVKFNVSNATIIRKGDSTGKGQVLLNYGIGTEFLQKNFSQIERFRSVEFDRDWNRNTNSIINNDQWIGNGSLGLDINKVMSLVYTFHQFTEGKNFSGVKHGMNHQLSKGPLRVSLQSSLLNTKNQFNSTLFYRHKSATSLRLRYFQLNFSDEMERNIFKYVPFDSVLTQSYQFWEWEGSINNVDTSGNYFKLFYRARKDLRAYSRILSDSASAQNAGLQFNFLRTRNHVLRTSLTLRQLNYLGPNTSGNAPDNNLVSRLEYAPKLWKGFLQSTLYFESGYGLELRREFSYIEVAAGQGQYFWNDYNNNGIKELNEFELALYPDQAIYIRVWTPTNTYVKVNRDQFSYSMFLRPSVFRKQNSSSVMKFLARLSTQTAYRMDKKSQAGNEVIRLNLFDVNSSDTTLTSMAFNFRQALFFNQSSPVFGFDYTFSDNRNKQLLTNGFESRNIASHEFHSRWNITKDLGIFLNAQSGLKINASQFFVNRNFSIQYLELEPRVAYQPSTAFRAAISYKRTEKQNILLNGGQFATLDDIGLDIKFNQLGKGSINAKANFILIQYNAELTTPVAFEMLNALRPGQNFTWNLTYQRNLSNNMQISISYDGRKSPGNKFIHIGGAQVRAFF